MSTELLNSFGAVYRLIERPRVARRVVAILLVMHMLLSGYSAYVHSPTLNEPGHLVAGLSNWKFGRFDIYKVDPPLVQIVAALPVMAVGYNENWSGFYNGPGARPEMAMGADLVKANGERSFFLFMIARWICIPFSWLGAIACYLWARDLYGRPAGVMATSIWCFEPNILAHTSLMTPDAGATALGLASCYVFWRWLKKPSWRQAMLTGVVLGWAELTKTTLILFYPLWPVMWLIYRIIDQRTASNIQHPNARTWIREAGMLALCMILGLYVLNLGYGFEGSFTQLKDFTFVSDLLTGAQVASPSSKEGGQGGSTLQVHPASDVQYPIPTNRFANSYLGNIPVPFPKNYLLGIDIQQKDFEHYGRPSYLRGEWRDHGWWYYYLYACAIKVPLGLWLLGLLALAARMPLSLRETTGEGAFSPRLYGKRQADESPRRDAPRPTSVFLDEFILLFPGVVIFTVVSSKTGFSEHMRYVLPSFPFSFIAISRTARLLSPANEFSSRRLTITSPEGYSWFALSRLVSPLGFRRCRMTLFSAVFAVSLCSWLIVSSVWIYPHSLSYFCEFIGGPIHGPEHLLGSNVDWGQDLIYARRWYDNAVSPAENVTLIRLSNYCALWGKRNYAFGEGDTGIYDSEVADQTIQVVSANVLYGQQCLVGCDGSRVFVPPNALLGRKKDATITSCGYSCRVLYARPVRAGLIRKTF